MGGARVVTAITVIFASIVTMEGAALAIRGIVTTLPTLTPNAASVAAGWASDYEGSDEYTFGVLPAFNFQFGNRYVRLLGNDLAVNLLNHEVFQFGPSAYYRFGRDKNDIDDKVVKKIHEVDDAVELGAFTGVLFVNKGKPRLRWGTNLEFLHDVSGEHDGYVIQLSTWGWYPVVKLLDLGLSLGSSYASDGYMKTYFGVSHKDATKSGLDFYDADAGIKDMSTFSPWH